MVETSQGDATPEVIGAHYRVLAELGRGGMARVVRVTDQRSGTGYALKQLFPAGDRAATLRAMFEREYHTLVDLAHPHIVRVFDYGVEQDNPYYTMELLEGSDVRAASRGGTLPVAEVCSILRDCASALSLVHSRRMVHRDVGPRNVWLMPNGRAKLIDFGTLVAMGAETRIAGTPPFVPPEALNGQPLDARCDLYALGALGYFLLTDRHAYPARSLAELVELWHRRPKRPDVLRPELPRALSDLVMAMISQDARGRPPSAAEVYERLSAIGGLPVEQEQQLAQAFLTSPKLVGRAAISRGLIKRVRRAAERHGSCVALVAPAGLGRSRMLADAVLSAKLSGALTIHVHASAMGSGPLALAAALLERLLEAQPSLALLVAADASVLAELSPGVRRALADPTPITLTPFERARKLRAAIVKLIDLTSQQQRLVIAVDDVHRADGASLFVLGRLSLLARDHNLLIVTTCDSAALDEPPPALAQLVNNRHRLDLQPLSAADTRELLASLFEDVPGLEPMAQWLHELSAGSPQSCMQYAQYLVDQGIARYGAGRWQLPAELRSQGLPKSLGAMLEQRIAGLSADARTLGLGLALARDQTRAVWQPETHVLFEDFPRLLDVPEPARAFAALDALLRVGLLQQRDGYYVLGQGAVVDALLQNSDAQARRPLHARLAQVFAQPSYPHARWFPVRQHLLAGEGALARTRLVAQAKAMDHALADWGAMRLSLMAQCGIQVLEDWEADSGAPLEGILLRRFLVLICSVYDWRLARFGAAQLERLGHDCGLQHWQSLETDLPAAERIAECLRLAEQTYDRAPPAERGMRPPDALRELAGCSLMLSGAFVNSHDVAHSESLQALLAPLTAASPTLAILAELCKLGYERVSGREVFDKIVDLGVTQLFTVTGLPDSVRQGGAGVHLHVQAVEDARRGNARGFGLMDLLASVIGDDMFLVVHGRWLLHAFVGNASAAKLLYKQVELITEDDVWRRRAHLFAEAELHALVGDLRGLTRTSEALQELAEKFPDWLPWWHWARAGLQRLRGEFAAAQAELALALAHARPGEHRAWGRIAASHAELWLLRNDPDQALSEASAIVQTVESLALDRTTGVAAERIRALAHSQRGEAAQAQACLSAAFALAQAMPLAGLPSAPLYEAQAKLALARADGPACVSALEQLWTLLKDAEAPALVTAYEALREESLLVLHTPGLLPSASMRPRSDDTEQSALFTQLHTRLSAFALPRERAREALECLLEDTGCSAGHLFLFDRSGLFEAATHAADGGDEVLALATSYLAARGTEFESVTATVELSDLLLGDVLIPLPGNSRGLAPVLLSDQRVPNPLMVGVALITVAGARIRAPRAELVRVISRCLLAAGDSLGVALDD
jgi:type II secretory pathway predicted ATPase ExeA